MLDRLTFFALGMVRSWIACYVKVGVVSAPQEIGSPHFYNPNQYRSEFEAESCHFPFSIRLVYDFQVSGAMNPIEDNKDNDPNSSRLTIYEIVKFKYPQDGVVNIITQNSCQTQLATDNT